MLTACYDHYVIDPPNIQQLDGLGGPGGAQKTVQTEDGPEPVTADSDLMVITDTGETVEDKFATIQVTPTTFDATPVGGSEIKVPMPDIQRVDVANYDAPESWVMGLGVGVPLAALAVSFTLLAIACSGGGCRNDY
jgi:hypothetical protein